MAPAVLKIITKVAHPRGQATVEAAATLAVFVAFTVGILAQSYLLWARVWLGYAVEQSLYCLAESKPTAVCERRFRTQSRRALPIGHFNHLNLYPGETQWSLDLEWRCKGHKQSVRRTLTLAELKANQDSRWSSLPRSLPSRWAQF